MPHHWKQLFFQKCYFWAATRKKQLHEALQSNRITIITDHNIHFFFKSVNSEFSDNEFTTSEDTNLKHTDF
jgi:hypothetical protein